MGKLADLARQIDSRGGKTQEESKTMRVRKGRTAAQQPRRKTAGRILRRLRGEGRVRPGSKLERIVGLLMQPGGCTRKQVMEEVGWPSVSLQQQATAAGLKLRVQKVAGVKYYSAAC